MKVKEAIEKYNKLSVPLRASFWFLICSFLQKGISALSALIFTRLMTTAEYGQYEVFNSWLAIVTAIVTLHLYTGVYLQGLVKFDKDAARFAASLQGLTTTLVVLWTVIYLVFRSFWNSLLGLTTVQVLAMLIMIWASTAFNLWAGQERVNNRYRILVIVTLAVSFLKPLIGVVFVSLSEDKVTARILGLALVEVIGYCSFFIIQLRRGKTFCSKAYWKYALAFNLPLVPHYLAKDSLNSADRIMIKYYFSAAEAGIYGLAYSVSQIMRLFNTALSWTITPYIFKSLKAKKPENVSGLANITLPFIAALNLLMILFAPEIIAIAAPPAYYEAIWVIPPITMSVYFMFTSEFFTKFSMYYGKTRFIMLSSLLAALLNILLNALFIPKFGYYAAGYTTLVCYIVYVGAHYLGMKRVCRKHLDGNDPYNAKYLLKISAGFLALGFLFLLTYNHSFIRYGSMALVLVVLLIQRKKIAQMVKNLVNLKGIR